MSHAWWKQYGYQRKEGTHTTTKRQRSQVNQRFSFYWLVTTTLLAMVSTGVALPLATRSSSRIETGGVWFNYSTLAIALALSITVGIFSPSGGVG